MEVQGTAAREGAPAPRLRPLSFGEILDVAIKLCVANAATLLRAVVFVVLPVQIVSTIIMISTGSAEFDVFGDTSGKTTRETNIYLAGQGAAALLQIIAVSLASAACYRAIAKAYLAQRPDWRESLRFAVKRFPQMVWIYVIYMTAFVVGVIVLVIPMALIATVPVIVVGAITMIGLFVWLYVVWSFAIPALLVEDVRGVKALKRSYELVSGRWWQTFAIMVLGFMLAYVTSSVVQGVFVGVILVGVDSSSLLAWLILGLAGFVSLLITTPFQAALLLVIYFDLRVRKEGFDLELLAEHFGDRGLAPAAAPAAEPPAGLAPPQPQTGGDIAAPYWPAPAGLRPDEREQASPGPDPGPPPPGWAPPA
ncbi:MAG: hypothetical protein ACRDLS_16205 [Solirubrobacteraceae bacterium]